MPVYRWRRPVSDRAVPGTVPGRIRRVQTVTRERATGRLSWLDSPARRRFLACRSSGLVVCTPKAAQEQSNFDFDWWSGRDQDGELQTVKVKHHDHRHWQAACQRLVIAPIYDAVGRARAYRKGWLHFLAGPGLFDTHYGVGDVTFHEPILWRHISWDQQSPDREMKEHSR